jgi:hypothetical protein
VFAAEMLGVAAFGNADTLVADCPIVGSAVIGDRWRLYGVELIVPAARVPIGVDP